jgi:hypothetical protein
MHALVVQLEIEPERRDEALDFLRTRAVPMISSGAGFVGGTWMLSEDGTSTRSVLVYDSKQQADEAFARASHGPQPGAPTRLVSAEVFEVVAQA